jgi:hypothetical protein
MQPHVAQDQSRQQHVAARDSVLGQGQQQQLMLHVFGILGTAACLRVVL